MSKFSISYLIKRLKDDEDQISKSSLSQIIALLNTLVNRAETSLRNTTINVW